MFGDISTKKVFIFLIISLCLTNFSIYAQENNENYKQPYTSQEEIFSEYMTNLRTKIQRNWNPPEFAQGCRAVVKFRINRYGEILMADIIESSNDIVFDASAIESLRKSEPFAKFPATSGKGSLAIQYTFETAFAKTDNMKEYLHLANKNYNVDNLKALKFIDLAIDEVKGDASAYYLYAKRSKIKKALGDFEGAAEDLEECKILKTKFDKKRINTCKLIAEMEKSPFAYFSLAHAYDNAEDYEKALEAIDKAIEMTDLNNSYKRYRLEILEKLEK